MEMYTRAQEAMDGGHWDRAAEQFKAVADL
jgi:outer membrane protein assembly factor BamD (BamD/ComL family)